MANSSASVSAVPDMAASLAKRRKSDWYVIDAATPSGCTGTASLASIAWCSPSPHCRPSRIRPRTVDDEHLPKMGDGRRGARAGRRRARRARRGAAARARRARRARRDHLALLDDVLFVLFEEALRLDRVDDERRPRRGVVQVPDAEGALASVVPCSVSVTVFASKTS